MMMATPLTTDMTMATPLTTDMTMATPLTTDMMTIMFLVMTVTQTKMRLADTLTIITVSKLEAIQMRNMMREFWKKMRDTELNQETDMLKRNMLRTDMDPMMKGTIISMINLSLFIFIFTITLSSKVCTLFVKTTTNRQRRPSYSTII